MSEGWRRRRRRRAACILQCGRHRSVRVVGVRRVCCHPMRRRCPCSNSFRGGGVFGASSNELRTHSQSRAQEKAREPGKMLRSRLPERAAFWLLFLRWHRRSRGRGIVRHFGAIGHRGFGRVSITEHAGQCDPRVISKGRVRSRSTGLRKNARRNEHSKARACRRRTKIRSGSFGPMRVRKSACEGDQFDSIWA